MLFAKILMQTVCYVGYTIRENIMQIAIDAMGTDLRPVPDIEGSIQALREIANIKILLVGDQTQIEQELKKYTYDTSRLEIVHASEQIRMDDKPSLVVKSKQRSSIHIGLELLGSDVDAFVSMGNTGAIMSVATLKSPRRIRGVNRPALSAIFNILNNPTIFLDIGANSDSKVEWMIQFAIMGSIYADQALGLKNPRIGLLSNGEEDGKGTLLIREAGEQLRQQSSLNFVGNVEPKEIFAGATDVVVADGFTGNLLTKTFEASTRYLSTIIREEITQNPISSIGGALIKPAMQRVRKRIDTSEIGGAPLLGVNGVVIIGHGSSNANGVKNAIHQAKRAVDGKIIQAIRDNI